MIEHLVILIQVMYCNEQATFTTEALAAMILGKLKKTAEEATKAKVHDVVISVPAFWTDSQRRALLDASQIAGLNCLRLINDSAAGNLLFPFLLFLVLVTSISPSHSPNITNMYPRSCPWIWYLQNRSPRKGEGSRPSVVFGHRRNKHQRFCCCLPQRTTQSPCHRPR